MYNDPIDDVDYSDMFNNQHKYKPVVAPPKDPNAPDEQG
jgi:hypothetical protein